MTPIIYVLNWIHRFIENGVVVRDVTFMGVYDSKEKVDEAAKNYSEENPAYVPYCNDDVTEWGEFEIIERAMNESRLEQASLWR